MNKYIYLLFFATALLSACNKDSNLADAYGNFEAREILVSAETSGKIIAINISEGQEIQKDFIAVVIDSQQLYLKKEEIKAKQLAAISKKTNIEAQAAVYKQQLEVLLVERNRIDNMLADGAATSKQQDDINGQIEITKKQIIAVKSNLSSIMAEVKAFSVGIAQVEDLIERSVIHAPNNGVVLSKYIEEGELAPQGKALFKMADLRELELKAYVSGNQLSSIVIGQKADVFIDGIDGEAIRYDGVLSWISTNAEFTPKNIQTKEERLSQVYAIKVKVKNDGALKINMPAEVRF